ncbi:MAG: DNA methyltransferase [Candidatus Hodarchaeales archaeon]
MNNSLFQVKREALVQIEHSADYKSGIKHIIEDRTTDINILIEKAINYYNEADFIEAARVFRQLGRLTRNIEYEIENKGKYSEKNRLNDLTGKEWLRNTKSWLIVDGKPSDLPYEIKDHPASFPPDLAKHFIRFFTKKGGWVFDPFMGIGSTLAAAVELERNCWGTELNNKYTDYARKRIKNNGKKYFIINEDIRNSVELWEKKGLPVMDLIVTSPPYWNMLEKSRGGVQSVLKQRSEKGLDTTYGNDKRDLGNIDDYKEYLEELIKVLYKSTHMVRKGGWIIIILQNVRPKDGLMRPLAWDFALKFARKDDIELKQEFIWLQDQKFMGIWGYPYSYVSNVHHHYCLVFQKV